MLEYDQMIFDSVAIWIISGASLLLALFIFSQSSNRLVNRMMAIFSLSVAVWTFGQAMGEVAGDKTAVLFWTRLNIGAAVLLPAFYLHFIFALLERTKKEKITLTITYSLAAALLLLLCTPLFVKDVAPVAAYRYYPQPGVVYPFFAAYLSLVFLYAFLQLFRGYRRAAGEKKNRLLYVILASVIGFFGGITAFLPVWGIDLPVLSNYALPAYLIIVIYAIVKHHLLDVSIVIREGLIYSVLTLIFTGFYALAILAANYLFWSVGHVHPFWTALIVVFISVLFFQPLKDRVQAVIDRLFFRGEYRYRQALLRADKLAALGTLAAGMAHEVKNPLAAIKGMTQVLKENINDADFIHDFMELVPRQLDRIDRIVENLLRVGRDRPMERREFDLNNLVKEIVDLNGNLCRQTGIEVKAQLRPLPLIWGDPEQLHQVFSNLIINAIQAMPTGGTLSVQSKVQGQELVCVIVEDTGGGIPSDRLENIFDPFFSLKEKGTGLGLFTAYRIIQEHGGTIEVESQIGKGTKFKICLPIRPKPSA